MRIAVVVNPAARSGAHTQTADRAARRLREHGHTVTAISGGSAEETSALIREALGAGADALGVVGGDGTVNLAAQELAGTGVPLGVIPAGSGNDLAAHLGIPALRPEQAADIIDAGHTRTIDLARLTRADGSSRLYTTVLASGFDSAVNDRANRMRWPRGEARYNLAILLEFLGLRSIPFTLEVDGEHVDGPLVMASVGNTPAYGGGIPICPAADAEDGLLDVTIVRPRGRLRLLQLLPTVYRGTHVDRPEVETFQGRQVTLRAHGVTAYADGDPIAALPVQIEAVPRALTVVVP
ncbi:MAG: diacylglycerol kinase [Microbacterium sp.]|uniref:diacylglycerol kinase n=1 Tax=Microbacterium sp. TaxID=51671 RepID=UPI0039E71DF3